MNPNNNREIGGFDLAYAKAFLWFPLLPILRAITINFYFYNMKKLPLHLSAPRVKSNEEFVVALKREFSVITNNQLIIFTEGEKIWQKVFKAHNESSRAYHNLSHLYSILKIFDQFQALKLDQTIYYWTTFFHDYVYKATRKDNEAKSAAIAKEILTPFLSTKQLEVIITIIESTAQHQPLTDVPEQYSFLDADLAILASEEVLYDKYTAAIREEYRIYPDFLYRPGRKKVLEHFLERDQIYYTSIFQVYEEKARANLERELIGLR